MSMTRSVVGRVAMVARVMGMALVVLGVISLPQMRSLTGRMAGSVELIASVALGVVGVVWLIAVEGFLRFFDQFLSRN
jgi:hypothetical protein